MSDTKHLEAQNKSLWNLAGALDDDNYMLWRALKQIADETMAHKPVADLQKIARDALEKSKWLDD